MSSSDPTPPEPAPPHYALSRRLPLPLLVLYGLGVTIGAGIYVLIGLTAEEAGMYAPLSFLLAAAIVTFSAWCTYAGGRSLVLSSIESRARARSSACNRCKGSR